MRVKKRNLMKQMYKSGLIKSLVEYKESVVINARSYLLKIFFEKDGDFGYRQTS